MMLNEGGSTSQSHRRATRPWDPNPFVLDDGQRRIEMYHFGWAHTRGDSFVFLPKEKVICTGDALANGGFNFIGMGNIRNWRSVLAVAKALGAEHVLPGHGRPGGANLFDGQMQFLAELQKAVQQQIDAGKKLEDLVYREGDPSFRLGNLKTNVHLPDSLGHWFSPDRLAMQVTNVYEQLTAVK